MQIITLTTDMGYRDHYVAAIKGSILKHCPQANIIDVSHSIKPFDVAEAAMYLSYCINDFPEDTVHIIGVDSEPMINFGGSEGSFPSIMRYKNQYFIATDNGVFGALLGENEPQAFYRIDDVLSNLELFKFPTKNMLVPAACKLLNGEKVDKIASEFHTFKRAFVRTAIIESNLIKGNVTVIDSYGNIITNVHKSLFNRFGNDIPFTIYYRNKEYHIDVISPTYNSVPPGERVAIFNDAGMLEIAVNRGANAANGGAEKLFGIRVGDVVRIEFTPRGSRSTLDSFF